MGTTETALHVDAMGPHQDQPVRLTGAPLNQASAAIVMIHGRGATAESMLTMVPLLNHSEFAYLAPQAAGGTWYPHSFLAPIISNEPGFSSGLQVIERVLAGIVMAGIPYDRTILFGFSQGACLALEFAARHARRYGGIAGLSGGLIGPDGTPRDYTGSFEGTPIFLGCSDVDPYIPTNRVHWSAQVMRELGAEVTTRLYPGLGHLVNQDELAAVRHMMDALGRGGNGCRSSQKV